MNIKKINRYIMIEIIKYMDYSTQLSFILTCKRFKNINRKYQLLKLEEKESYDYRTVQRFFKKARLYYTQKHIKEELDFVYIDNKDIRSLPYCFGRILQNVLYLQLRNIGLTNIPDSFGLLNCINIDISFNDITYLPDSFCNLKNLRQLLIGHNKLEYLPNNIGNLNLHLLFLPSNKLKELPKSIGNLTHCYDIDISYNELKYIPETIGNIKYLSILNISNNKLKELPDSINNLEYLTELILFKNRLKYIPDLSNCFYLNMLNIYNNVLVEFTDSLDNLILLENIQIFPGNTKLKRLPLSIKNKYSMKRPYIEWY